MTPETSAIIGAILLAIGVAAPPDQVAGGLFLAVAMAFLMMAWSQPEDRKSYWLTLLTAVLAAIAAAVAHDTIDFLAGWSLQFLMGGAGLFSRFLAEGAILFGRTSRDQLGSIPRLMKEKIFGKDESDA